jgi:hypothetical protein
MATSIGFFLSAVIAVGIIFIGGRFLAAPSLAPRNTVCRPVPSRIRGRISLRKAFVTLRLAYSPQFP